MFYESEIRTAAELTGQARAAAELAATQYRLNRFLPSRDNYSLTFNFEVGQIGLTDKAEYRAFDTSTRYGRTSGGSARAGKLPPVGRRYRVGEFEQLQLVMQNDLLGAKLEEYARKGGVSIAARVALAQGQAIEFGKVVLEENGLEVEVDYGRLPEHSVVAPIKLSNPDAPILEYLESWTAPYLATNGSAPGATLLSQRIMSFLTRNKEIIRDVVGRSTDLPSRVSPADVMSVLARFNVFGVEQYDQAIDGERIIGDDKIVFLPSDGGIVLDGGVLGTTEWGITAESIQGAYGIGDSERPGIFAAHFTQPNPQSAEVNTSAVVIPALTNANATFVATVL